MTSLNAFFRIRTCQHLKVKFFNFYGQAGSRSAKQPRGDTHPVVRVEISCPKAKKFGLSETSHDEATALRTTRKKMAEHHCRNCEFYGRSPAELQAASLNLLTVSNTSFT